MRVDVLGVGGKVYVKTHDGMVPGAGGIPASALADRWVLDAGPVSADLLSFDTPELFAARLRDALAPSAGVVYGDGGSVNGTPSLKAVTPTGDVYVSRTAPHRVLRYAGRGGQNPAGGSGQTDVAALAAAEASGVYDALRSAAHDLANAVDPGVDFAYANSDQLSCTASGCSVTTQVTSSTTAPPAASGGQVTATLTANFTVGDAAVGRCTSTAVLPLDRSATIGCTDPAAGKAYVAADKRLRARAEARSAAAGGVSVGYSVDLGAETFVTAGVLTAAEVTAQIDQLERAQDEVNGCGDSGGRPPSEEGDC